MLLMRKSNEQEALLAQRECFEIRQALVETDPRNSVWQRDLMVSNIRLGELTKLEEYYLEALRIGDHLKNSGNLSESDERLVNALALALRSP
jgi:hypothetical protein